SSATEMRIASGKTLLEDKGSTYVFCSLEVREEFLWLYVQNMFTPTYTQCSLTKWGVGRVRSREAEFDGPWTREK
ncbi:hypothetical protein H5410_050518, partial [Solanum commersonii]